VGVFLYVLVRINTISVTIDRQVLISLVSGAGGNESDISKTFLREISPRGDSHGRSFVGCHDKKTFFRCGILDGNFSNFVGRNRGFWDFQSCRDELGLNVRIHTGRMKTTSKNIFVDDLFFCEDVSDPMSLI